MRTALVFVHGLFLNGAEFTLLRRRLADAQACQTYRFSYPTVRGSMGATLARLRKFVANVDAERVHFVGHSLGGIVLCRFFQREGDDRAGRVLLLGSPLLGSRSAVSLARHGWLRRVVGPLVAEEFLAPCESRAWSDRHELGVIAGSRPMGLGRFFARFAEDNDGTVAVSETRLPGLADHLVLPVSHMGMLVSSQVAAQANAFLSSGRFLAGNSTRERPGQF